MHNFKMHFLNSIWFDGCNKILIVITSSWRISVDGHCVIKNSIIFNILLVFKNKHIEVLLNNTIKYRTFLINISQLTLQKSIQTLWTLGALRYKIHNQNKHGISKLRWSIFHTYEVLHYNGRTNFGLVLNKKVNIFQIRPIAVTATINMLIIASQKNCGSGWNWKYR